MNKCGGKYDCYPDCSLCGLYMDSCDGCNEYIDSLPEEESISSTPKTEPGIRKYRPPQESMFGYLGGIKR
jgi:hypothetical protein